MTDTPNQEQMEAYEEQAISNIKTMAINNSLSIQRLLSEELANIIDPADGEKIATLDQRKSARITDLSRASADLAETIVLAGGKKRSAEINPIAAAN